MFHFYLTAMMWVAAYTLFAYSVVIFLNETVQSTFLVGIFLGMGSLMAVLLDVPFGYAQKVISPRWLLATSILGMMTTVTIFLLAYSNISLVFVAALLYGLSHDLYDVTMLSYIFNSSLPAQYGQNISLKNVAEALGILFGLIFSGALLFFGSMVAQLALMGILLVSLIIVLAIFDRDKAAELPKDRADALSTVTHTAQELTAGSVRGLKTSAISIIDVTQKGLESVKQSLDKGKIILKPLQPGKDSTMSKIWEEIRESFRGIATIFTGEKLNIPLLWSMVVLLLFSFWDTFVITFQPLFLSKFLVSADVPSFISGGVIMAVFILPLFGLLVPFSKWADTYGRQKFIIGGLIISGVSLFFFGQVDNIWVLALLGMSNSVGYAAVMPSVQAMFAEKLNEHIAFSMGKTEIDSNTGAAPLKMLLNVGNVVGQMAGGTLIAIFGFNIFFMFFGGILVMCFVGSLFMYPWLSKPPYILATEEGELVE